MDLSRSSSARFAATPDLLRCLGEQITSKAVLCQLCLVSKTFNAEFSWFLYREICVRGVPTEVWKTLRKLQFSNNPRIQHVRKLCVNIRPGQRYPTRFFVERWDSLGSHIEAKMMNKAVQGLLPLMPRLMVFEWINIPLATATIRSLADHAETIKSIHIQYPPNMEQNVLRILDPADRNNVAWSPEHAGVDDLRTSDDMIYENRLLYRLQDLSQFRHLHHLTLENLYDDLGSWNLQITKLLANSPNLQTLALSISPSYPCRPDYFIQERAIDYIGFFNRLCENYANTASPPLRLSRLSFSLGISPESVTDLLQLTDLAYLNNVHIHNDGPLLTPLGSLRPENDDRGHSSIIPFEAFGPDHCPNLRQFSAKYYIYKIGSFLKKAAALDRSFTRHLAVFFHKECFPFCKSDLFDPGMGNDDYEDYAAGSPSLPMQFRMLDIDFHMQNTMKRELTNLVAHTAATIEGLYIDMLSCQHEQGNPDFSSDPLGDLVDTLGMLPRLSQLAVGRDIRGFLYGTESEISLVPEDFVGLAMRFAAAAPRLRYISVGSLFCEVKRSRDGRIELDELEEDEASGIEIFNHAAVQKDRACGARYTVDRGRFYRY
ncbi:hypothetical protein B0T19DRAFT_413191 [Cercophora scortea]|uniref:Uncharacterized protein n=1 Tax=Cercophora scortea TaxID=314031 RepID=A0AAE0MM32_9PEZI|nr:hypothetical protein B0T19DRAFT_413191 [Cercophora scortea]